MASRFGAAAPVYNCMCYLRNHNVCCVPSHSLVAVRTTLSGLAHIRIRPPFPNSTETCQDNYSVNKVATYPQAFLLGGIVHRVAMQPVFPATLASGYGCALCCTASACVCKPHAALLGACA